jgi:putative NADH-flavin reductase
MARVLIVGCGCRGRTLASALLAEGHAVRGTSRDPARIADIEASGVEGVVADPDRLATMMPAIEGVTVVCWLFGTLDAETLHGPRLASMLEHIVDTPVRGLVYETGGVDRSDAVARVRLSGATWRMPVEVVDEDPAAVEEWAAAMTAAVGRVLTG